MRALPRAVGALACLALTACATTGPASPPTSSAPLSSAVPASAPALDVAHLDPCTLLDRGELSTAVAASLPPGELQPDTDGNAVCLYDAPQASTSVLVLVAREAAVAGRGEDMVDQLPLDGRAEELHGVGEAAWFDYCPACPEPTATTLTVIEPPLEFTIALTLPAPDLSRRIILEELGRGVIGRLRL